MASNSKRNGLVLTLRTFILIIAAFALGIWAERVRARREFYLGRAAYFAVRQAEAEEERTRVDRWHETLRARAAKAEANGEPGRAAGYRRQIAEELKWSSLLRRNPDYAAYQRHYEQAAARPWYQTRPDPKEPK